MAVNKTLSSDTSLATSLQPHRQEDCKPGSVPSLVSAEANKTGVLSPLSESEGTLDPPAGEQYRKDQSLEISPRECDCPTWVIRCAHFGSDAVWMTCATTENYPICPCQVKPVSDVPTYGILHLSQVTPCPENAQPCHINWWDRPLFVGDSEAEALEAFFAAEAELLSRGEA